MRHQCFLSKRVYPPSGTSTGARQSYRHGAIVLARHQPAPSARADRRGQCRQHRGGRRADVSSPVGGDACDLRTRKCTGQAAVRAPRARHGPERVRRARAGARPSHRARVRGRASAARLAWRHQRIGRRQVDVRVHPQRPTSRGLREPGRDTQHADGGPRVRHHAAGHQHGAQGTRTRPRRGPARAHATRLASHRGRRDGRVLLQAGSVRASPHRCGPRGKRRKAAGQHPRRRPALGPHADPADGRGRAAGAPPGPPCHHRREPVRRTGRRAAQRRHRLHPRRPAQRPRGEGPSTGAALRRSDFGDRPRRAPARARKAHRLRQAAQGDLGAVSTRRSFARAAGEILPRGPRIATGARRGNRRPRDAAGSLARERHADRDFGASAALRDPRPQPGRAALRAGSDPARHRPHAQAGGDSIPGGEGPDGGTAGGGRAVERLSAADARLPLVPGRVIHEDHQPRPLPGSDSAA